MQIEPRSADEEKCKYRPVLATWGAMQVYDNLQAVVARPGDCFLQVGQLARNVGLAWPDLERPVPNGNADVVETGNGRATDEM